jgi:hypothetical protein
MSKFNFSRRRALTNSYGAIHKNCLPSVELKRPYDPLNTPNDPFMVDARAQANQFGVFSDNGQFLLDIEKTTQAILDSNFNVSQRSLSLICDSYRRGNLLFPNISKTDKENFVPLIKDSIRAAEQKGQISPVVAKIFDQAIDPAPKRGFVSKFKNVWAGVRAGWQGSIPQPA